MIITLQDTETREISAKIDELHEERGEAALGRVLTLLISTNEAELEHDLEVANNASREHPCRVIAVAPSSRKISPEEEHPTFLDAEIRFGSDAGAGEIIVLRPRGGLVRHADTLVIPLLVPDAPVVAWWPNEAPANLSKDLLGSMASSRITDAMHSSNPRRTMDDLRRNRSAKDVDMSWTRLTVWRAMIASMLDQPPHLPVSNVRVTGQKDYLPLDLLAAWLRLRLNVPVMIEEDPNATAVTGVYLTRGDGVLSLEQYQTAKKYGFQDKTIKRLAQVDALPVENYRAGFKMVDTCAAEFSANTPYFYSTYDGDNEAAEFIAAREAEAAANGQPKKKKVLVFGSGPIRIGQGIEFDYCSVHCVWTLKNHGCEAILVNNNPETVSTDFDTGDRLYFDPLNPESVDNIIATEKPDACVVQFGGQTAIKLAKHMDEIGLPILGTPADAIDEAEDRERFDELLERCKIPRAPGRTVFNLEEALAAADEIGLPVLMRPSYVLGGQNMIVA